MDSKINPNQNNGTNCPGSKHNSQEYYNTTDLQSILLEQSMATASTQTKEIYNIFLLAHKLGLPLEVTPSQIWDSLGRKFLLTSVRRSVTTLTKQGKLIKTPRKYIGVYGAPEYAWGISAEGVAL